MSDERGHTVRRHGYMVASGSITEGFDLYGPFGDEGKASTWAKKNLTRADWHVVPFKEVRADG